LEQFKSRAVIAVSEGAAHLNTKAPEEFKDFGQPGPPMRKRTYLDANAGVPLLPAVREAVVSVLGEANPSSVHAEGRRARAAIEAARSEVAASVGAKPENVIFTSGATEAAALALSPRILVGRESAPIGRLYVGATEHTCVLSGGRFPPAAVTRISVHRSGAIDISKLEQALAAHDKRGGVPCLALMLANNETGVIHHVAEAAALVKQHGGYFFCDAVQALGRIPLDIAALGADFISLSAHKIGGPQGIGAIVLADEAIRPPPLLAGGGQERRHRAGTENVAGIAGFGVAARLASHHLKGAGSIAELRDRLERELLAISPDARIVGKGVERLPNTTLFVLPGLSAEVAVMAFDLEGVAVSAGSACSSGKVSASHVLEAMSEGRDAARGGVRVSLPPEAKAEDVDHFIAAWRTIHGRLRTRQAA
jgi:cysteine desulfurase